MKILLKELINGKVSIVGSVFVKGGKIAFSGRGEDWAEAVEEDYDNSPPLEPSAFEKFAKWANSVFTGVGFFVDLDRTAEELGKALGLFAAHPRRDPFTSAYAMFAKGIPIETIAKRKGLPAAIAVLTKIGVPEITEEARYA